MPKHDHQITHHSGIGLNGPDCRAEYRGGIGIRLTTAWSMVDCTDCLRIKDEPKRIIHHVPQFGVIVADCGVATTSYSGWGDNGWGVVNCRGCINARPVEASEDDPELRVHRDDSEKQDALDMPALPEPDATPDAEWGDDIEPKDDPELRVHREDSAKQDAGPKLPFWPHDCMSCTYLGYEEVEGKDYDLYWCPNQKSPIARYGEHGDYLSGIGFVTREPMLALAYVKALHRGLVYFDLKDL